MLANDRLRAHPRVGKSVNGLREIGDDKMRVRESAGIEQIGRNGDVAGFLRVAVEIRVAEQARVRPSGLSPVKAQ